MAGPVGAIMRAEDVGFVAAGARMAIVPLLRGTGICVDIGEGLVISAVVNVGDGSGGILGEGNPMTTE